MKKFTPPRRIPHPNRGSTAYVKRRMVYIWPVTPIDEGVYWGLFKLSRGYTSYIINKHFKNI